MPLKNLLLALVGFAVTSAGAKAQFFTTGIVTGDSSVETVGTVVEAYNFGGATKTINGVTFIGTNNINGTFTGYTMNGPGIDTTGGGIVPTVGGGVDSNLSASLQNLEASGVHNSAGNLTFSVTGLTIGQSYSLQLFINANASDARSQAFKDGAVTSPTVTAGGNKAGNPSFNGGNNTGNNPPFIIDTFTASSTSETLAAQFGGGAGAQFSGFVLELVPEPSTWAMLGLGVAALIFAARHKAIRT